MWQTYRKGEGSYRNEVFITTATIAVALPLVLHDTRDAFHQG